MNLVSGLFNSPGEWLLVGALVAGSVLIDVARRIIWAFRRPPKKDPPERV